VSATTPVAGQTLPLEERARERDAALVRRCRTGEEAAWDDLVERFSGYVYTIVRRAFRLTPEGAEDAYQEVFTRVFLQLGNLRDEGALKPWIAQLTRRACIDRLRSGSREVPVEDPAGSAPAEAPMLEIEEAIEIERALAELPEPFHEAVERFFIRDQSYATIAEALAIAPGTVASRISRGLVMLRRLLGPDA
jgi:RNA polymerase sigma-70 factor (ECF subfamily)